VHGPELQAPHGELVTLRGAGPLKGHVVLGSQDVVSSGEAGQLKASRHVVVVHVGLEHMGQAQAALVELGRHPVDVPLRVDHGAASPSTSR